MNAYEIRHAVLSDAQSILFQDWQNRQDLERSRAEYEQRLPEVIPTPTVDDVIAAATKLKVFVDGDGKDVAPYPTK